MYINCAYLFFIITYVNCHQRAPPGVNPQQYHHAQPNNGQYQPPPQQQYQQGAPGVPPSQYQQQPHQQQFQQPVQKQQYQQPQQQYQQPPQQQYQQPPQQQPPPQQQYQPPAPDPSKQYQQGGPSQHAPQQNVLHGSDMKHEREHIKDHLEVPLDTSGMTEEELQYHYFKMHDADNNNKLDGQELIKSLFHWHDSENHHNRKPDQAPPEPKLFTDEELVSMIDPILLQDDKNKDGFIDYPEFVQAQRSASASSTST